MQDKRIKIKYYTDPVCSTCWIMEPYFINFLEKYKNSIEVEYKMGGLLRSWEQFPTPEGFESKEAYLSELWNEQSKKYGVVMNGDIWWEHPINSSFPASIGFYAAKLQDEVKAAEYLRLIREKLFLQEKDISQAEVIINAAIEIGLEIEKFKSDYASFTTHKHFAKDIEEMKQIQITRFPTLIFENTNGNKWVYSTFLSDGKEPAESISYWEKIINYLSDDVLQPSTSKTPPLIELFSPLGTMSASELQALSGLSENEVKHFLETNLENGELIEEKHRNTTVYRVNRTVYKIKQKDLVIKSACIVGGGIAGMALANTLVKNEVEVKIHERELPHRHKGFGFLILDNGVDALDVLGFGSKARQLGNPINKFIALNPQGERVIEQDMYNCLALRRKDLYKILNENLSKDCFEFESSYQSLIKDANNTVKGIQLKNDCKCTCDIIIACDGVRSEIRQDLFPDAQLEIAGEVEILGMIDYKLQDFEANEFIKVIDANQRVSMGILPLGKNRIIWFVQYIKEQQDEVTFEPSSMQDFCYKATEHFPKDFRDAIRATDFNFVFQWHSNRMDPLPQFHQGKVMLMGDAAHPVLPLTSQGANAALEDAIALKMLLTEQTAEESIERVYEKFYDLRIARIKQYVTEGDELLQNLKNITSENNYEVPLSMH
jgi:2-polyprenyl-6-methoxyphenol hydroxylase-like FAD-dependent oxidoreductase/predicted DsbA family dithiol-disulfide isomerase